MAGSAGGPGDGNQWLQGAAIKALGRAGVQRTDSRESAELILYAVVKVVAIEDETVAVRIR